MRGSSVSSATSSSCDSAMRVRPRSSPEPGLRTVISAMVLSPRWIGLSSVTVPGVTVAAAIAAVEVEGWSLMRGSLS
jgi:hypothetical protein